MRTGRDRGFTLVELLVVITIISILASMLMPGFARARESARKIVCSSQLHQLSMAVNMYSQDYDGCYPVAWAFWSPLFGKPAEPNLKTSILSYAKNDQIWWCPSWSGRYGINAWGNPKGGSYDFIVPTPDTQEVIGEPPTATSAGSVWNEAALQNPTNYPLLFCGSHWTRALNAHTGTSDNAFFNGTAQGGTNVAYADGHVKWVPLDKNTWDALYRTPR